MTKTLSKIVARKPGSKPCDKVTDQGLQTWLTWQVRRRRVDAEDGAAALEDVAVALEVVQMTLTALRQERGRLTQDKPRY